jgi:hypothetical protein
VNARRANAAGGIVVVLLALALAAPVAASVTRTTVVHAHKTLVPPALSPPLADPVWQKGSIATGFVDLNTLRPASLKTVAYLLYDDRALYVAFACDQRGVPIVAALTSYNSNVTSDDHVTLWIDTSGNGTRTYSFTVTPRGTIGQTSSENSRYAPPWYGAAKISGGNYAVTMAIPFADLRAHGGGTETWRINFERYVAGKNEDDTWAFEPTQTKVSDSQFWPLLTGIRIGAAATRPKPYADIYALGSGGSQWNVFQDGIGQFETIYPRNAGIDVTYPFTNTLAFVGTLNPDFSNVEEDQTTIAPQEFAKQYVEYRRSQMH